MGIGVARALFDDLVKTENGIWKRNRCYFLPNPFTIQKSMIPWDLESRKQQWNNQPITGLAINVVIGSFFRFCFVPPTILIESYSASNFVGLIFTMHRNTLRFLLRLQLRRQQKSAGLIPCWRFLLLLIRYRLWSSTPFFTLRCHVVNYTVIILNALLLSLQIVRL